MADIERIRVIRPSTRKAMSRSYKVNTQRVSYKDKLLVHIFHESTAFKSTFRFKGADVAERDSISFRVREYGEGIGIEWSGAKPKEILNF